MSPLKSKFTGVLQQAKNMDREGEPAPARRQRGAGGETEGKRGNPKYSQTTAYVAKKIYSAVQIAIIKGRETNGDHPDYSTLVEQLLSDWLKRKNGVLTS